jgi:hypothetical protein
MKAELASKEPRLSDRSMAKLLLHCTSRLSKPNRGWVLEGWPKTLAQAQVAFATEIKEEVSKRSNCRRVQHCCWGVQSIRELCLPICNGRSVVGLAASQFPADLNKDSTRMPTA